MGKKTFEYFHKDIPLLKKDMRTRLSFVILFSICFIAQLGLLIYKLYTRSATTFMAVVSAIVMLFALIFTILSLSFAFKDLQLINGIKKSGSVIHEMSLLPSISNDKAVKIYLMICKILAVAMLLVLACGITYNVLEIIYFSTFSFFIPMLVLVCIVGFNTVYHVKHEIETIQNTKEYSSIV